MRVIAGLYKSRHLIAPDGTEVTRPTSDRVKESLFNILMQEIEGASVLDLFAGSGALGIEAISRGAKSAVFVENHKSAILCLQKNLDSLKILHNAVRLVPKKIEDFLKMGHKNSETFNIIFADPPYSREWGIEEFKMLEESNLCMHSCLFVLEKSIKNEHKNEKKKTTKILNWSLQDVRKYGKTQLEFWRRNYD